MKRKLLILSASAGSGHVRAAQALQNTAALSFSEVFETTHIDMMDYIALPIKTAIKSYDVLVKQMPELWGFLYKKSDDATSTKHLRKLTRHINRMNAVRLYEYVQHADPDVIVCTHFLAAQTLFVAPKKYQFTQPICMVMTDYDKHGMLMMNGLSRYFVATDKMKHKMVYEGIDEGAIRVTGIPVSPPFYMTYDQTLLRKKYDIDAKNLMILILSGGFGLAHTDKLIPALYELKQPTTLVAVAGNNAALQKSLQKLKAPNHIDMRVLGWTDVIHEYMAMSDIVVTKPGGMTTTECIALDKPMIVIQPIPGQEEHNAEYILEHGYGAVAHGAADLLYYVQHLTRTQHKRPPMAAERILSSIQEGF